ncbi:MAG: C4-dicarboxylate ABC transporter, partial [Clostridium sp.]
MKLKKLVMLGIVGVMGLSLSACGRNSGNAAKETTAKAADASAAGTEAAGTVTIKVGHVEAEDRSTHQ